MCKKHWALVPPAIQRAVYASWNDGKSSPAYAAAVSDAIAALAVNGDLFLDRAP